jgi:hypothetical protein
MMNRAFSPYAVGGPVPGAVAPGWYEYAPLALADSTATGLVDGAYIISSLRDFSLACSVRNRFMESRPGW